jgi:NAD(P)H-dependent FMN reductase
MTVIGIISSPIRGGNVDRMVQYILEHSGKPAQFVNLTELSYSPCRACAHLCAKDNICRLDDDLRSLYQEMIDAEALVLGTPSYFNNLNGFMTVFLERLWAFRHQRFPLEGKPYAVIACGGVQSPRQAIESVQRRMSAYKAVLIGDVAFKSCILPCFKCGYGTVCEIGASQYVYGEEGRKQLKITKELFKRWEDTPEVKNQVDAITAKIKTL